MEYKQPKTLFERRLDTPDQNLYLVSIQDDGTVLSASGRNAHNSGAKTVSWNEFLQGDMNSLVEETMGIAVLNEVLEKLRAQQS
ncbi:hypothetical protein CWB89_16500 [Pseudoalteromonas piscicida]|uniref:Uncharacterized protein n=1 Tax=Pseudoalteromonas piscicida TaxID=43662 RepID=A0AAQ2IQT2_PSEO7|nr:MULTISPECIES: hypothetical protein [Pseudoalteromonas]KJY91593.1 hypothetical protein TW75_04200 [Pseudoalteromonas piscicida]TMN37680.1 hypothetical protein CWB94_15755 [Pseudoalteromonas piscicida]TMN45900.1 hypothetical protein CWB95_00080 [Pseudoalteromonas piscicida]TMN47605.1 hypothetical protein CWB91_21170 [Pseudoalteromonas piscicida]TMN53634.1 hypothetical protein CWB92_08190 [Pseudoalteromonas piscicida]